MKVFAFALILFAGQAIAQPVPLGQIIFAHSAFCATAEAAIEVARTVAADGFPAGKALIDRREDCIVGSFRFRLVRLVTFFRMPGGTLKVVEAESDWGKVYLITLSDLKGMEEVRQRWQVPQPT